MITTLLGNPFRLGAAVVGAGLLALGLWLLRRRVGLWFGGERTSGEVVDLIERRDGQGGVSYMPVVKFTDGDGATRQFQSLTGGSTQRWPVGAKLTVLFDPLQPARAEIASPLHFWTAPAGVIGFAALLLLFAWKGT